MVNVPLAAGWKLIDSLIGRGFPLEAAFWAQPREDENWVFYLVSPAVEKQGLGEAYQLIHGSLRDAVTWGIDPFSITIIGVDNPMAKAVADIVKPVANAEPNRLVRPLRARSLGGIPVGAAFIYPPYEPGIHPTY